MTRKPTPRVEIDIRGTLVGFLRRDIRQIDDRERRLVEQLVESQQRESGLGIRVTRIIIETDYPDPDRLAYIASYRVEVAGEDLDASVEANEGDDRGQ
jgi:hypothetical protein